MVYVIIVILE